jgi:3-oxoacyl-[acyl-carrier-protein] synthase-3
MTPSAHIVGWGKYVPPHVVTNDELAQRVDTSDDWIRTRTGIGQRCIAGIEDTTASMAIRAARQALEVAGMRPVQIDLIIVATITPDHLFPATACAVQDALGASHAAAFDLSAGCSGFVYGLGLSANLIRAGAYHNVLVIGAETLSRITDWADRSTCVLFGDGAGAVLLHANAADGGVLSSVLGSDGSGGDVLIQPAGGSRHPATHQTVSERMHFLQMKGREVYRFAVRQIPAATEAALTMAGLDMSEVRLIIPHQANQRIIEAAARALGVPSDLFFSNLESYGNTSAASVPIALCEALEQGRIQRDDLVVCVGFGAGLTWAASVIRWSVPLPAAPLTRWESFTYRLSYVHATVRSMTRRFIRWLLSRWTEG